MENKTDKTMKKSILLILVVLVCTFNLYAQSNFNAANISAGGRPVLFGGNNPHDSLLFDGENGTVINTVDVGNDCFVKVGKVKGKVKGRVLNREIFKACGDEYETLFTFVDKESIKAGDMLVEGSYIETPPDGWAELLVYIAGDNVFNNEIQYPSFPLYVNAGSTMGIPNISQVCSRQVQKQMPPPEVPIDVIKGVVTYDQDEGKTTVKMNTKGKRSSVKHTKTRYSHEVKIDGNDTLDIIRVYKGSVEVTFMKTDASDEDAVSKEMEKLSKDMEAGKLSMEELQAKMSEFQSYGQNLNELMTPINVDEGSKCIITKFKRTVEPLGAGDEDQVFEQ